MTSLCSIFTDALGFRSKLGRLAYDAEGVKAPLLMLDPAALVPVCRALKERGEEVLKAAGMPYANIARPPLIDASDLQVAKGRGREQVGHLYTDTRDGDGGVLYQARLNVGAVLKHLDYWGLHLHVPSPEEAMARSEAQTGAGNAAAHPRAAQGETP